MAITQAVGRIDARISRADAELKSRSHFQTRSFQDMGILRHVTFSVKMHFPVALVSLTRLT
jgi:hypothetical protein